MRRLPDDFDVSQVDPFDEDFLADPYPYHSALRDAGPVVRLERYGIWAVARHAEVKQVLSDWQTFCSSAGGGLANFHEEEPWRPPSIILEADPPLHTRTRGVLAKVLSRPTLEALRATFEHEAELLLDRVLEKGTFDAVAELTEAFPLKVFPDAVGLTPDGRENLLPYGNMAFNAFGPRNRLFEAAFADAQKVVSWIQAQCRREALTPGKLASLIYAAADDGQVSEAEAALLVRSLLTAGLDTTIYSLGNAVHLFATHPDQWRLLRADPKLIRNALDEVVRLASPVQTFFRTTTREVELAGATIPADEKVLAFLGAANRDPRAWDEPDRFDIRRKVGAHVGFGTGIHQCVGQMLARLEAEALLGAMVRRVESIELADTPTWRLNNTLRGLDRLPVAMTASREQRSVLS